MSSSGIVRFTDYLKMLPPAWVFEKFVRAGESSARKILSSSMIDDAAATFVDENVLKEHFCSLSDTDQLACALVYMCGDYGFRVTDFSGFENPLIVSFLVYAGSNAENEVRLFGFHEFRKPLLSHFVNVIVRMCPPAEIVDAVSVWNYQCINDITMIVTLAAQNYLKRRKNGSLVRAGITQLRKVVEMYHSVKNDQDDYITKIMLGYCLNERLLYQSDTEYLFNKPAYSLWNALDRDEKYKSIRMYALEYNGGVWLQLIEAILVQNVYLSTELFPSYLQDEIFEAFASLVFTSDVAIRKVSSGYVFCKSLPVTQIESQAPGVIILPDFSVIIIRECNTNDLCIFTQVGAINSFDKVYKGKVDKTVLCDSLSRGTDGASIIDWLTRWSAPSNVIETVKEWLREFYRLYITDLNVLISSDEKVTFQINSFEPFRKLIQPVSAHALYIINRGEEQNVRSILSSLGFDYRMSGQGTEVTSLVSAEKEEQTVKAKWIPFVETRPEEIDNQSMRGTKYGTELKNLDINETVHVIDYAILTGQQLSIDYEGSPYIKEGLYTFKPHNCEKGIDPVVEGEVLKTKSRKRFYIKKIRKIGVVSK
ncbi:MAG: hypothetical protein ACM31E_01155 [Fibrobacterota bacterium]|nr:hypothetical protein [Chitinispirillaceae bacterium]